MAKVNLDIQSILDKQFNIDFRGYSAEEVDAYLDLVIEDYQTYQEITGELNEKIEELERTNASLRAKLIEVEGRTRALEANPTPAQQGADNLDILKRLSRLEDEVFAQQRDRREYIAHSGSRWCHSQRKVHARTVCDDGSVCAGPRHKTGQFRLTAEQRPKEKSMVGVLKVSQ